MCKVLSYGHIFYPRLDRQSYCIKLMKSFYKPRGYCKVLSYGHIHNRNNLLRTSVRTLIFNSFYNPYRFVLHCAHPYYYTLIRLARGIQIKGNCRRGDIGCVRTVTEFTECWLTFRDTGPPQVYNEIR